MAKALGKPLRKGIEAGTSRAESACSSTDLYSSFGIMRNRRTEGNQNKIKYNQEVIMRNSTQIQSVLSANSRSFSLRALPSSPSSKSSLNVRFASSPEFGSQLSSLLRYSQFYTHKEFQKLTTLYNDMVKQSIMIVYQLHAEVLNWLGKLRFRGGRYEQLVVKADRLGFNADQLTKLGESLNIKLKAKEQQLKEIDKLQEQIIELKNSKLQLINRNLQLSQAGLSTAKDSCEDLKRKTLVRKSLYRKSYNPQVFRSKQKFHQYKSTQSKPKQKSRNPRKSIVQGQKDRVATEGTEKSRLQ